MDAISFSVCPIFSIARYTSSFIRRQNFMTYVTEKVDLHITMYELRQMPIPLIYPTIMYEKAKSSSWQKIYIRQIITWPLYDHP